MKKLVVILPVRDKFRRAKRYAFLPPTTLSVLASLTPSDWEVEFIDENIAAYDEDQEFAKIRSSDLVAISVVTAEARRAYEISERAREIGKTVVLGGYHITACPEEAEEHADAIVVGRAEVVWEEVIKDLENGTLKKRYENERETRFVNPNLRQQPWLNGKADQSSPVGRYTIQHMTYTTVGCAQRCAFCFNSKRRLPFATRDVSDVRKELEDFRGQMIGFCDDDITANKRHSKELFEAISDLDLRWLGFASMRIGMPEQQELLNLAAGCGCEWLFMGFESFSKAVLKRWNKPSNNPDQYVEITKRVHDAGIKVCSSFVLGAEGEEMSDVEKIGDFIDQASPERVDIYFLTPFPGTVLHDQLQEDHPGILIKDWSLYDAQHIVCNLSVSDRAELVDKFNCVRERAYSWRSVLKRSLFDSQWGLIDRLILFSLNRHKRRTFAGIAESLQQDVKK